MSESLVLVRGGDDWIRTSGTACTVLSLSKRVPSANSDTSPDDGAPPETRTRNKTRIRSPLLYPIELTGHVWRCCRYRLYHEHFEAHGEDGWCRLKDSNLRTRRGRVYSPLQLPLCQACIWCPVPDSNGRPPAFVVRCSYPTELTGQLRKIYDMSHLLIGETMIIEWSS